MTVRRCIGYAILSSPFVALFAFTAWNHGVLTALGLFATVFATVALIGLGVELTQ